MSRKSIILAATLLATVAASPQSALARDHGHSSIRDFGVIIHYPYYDHRNRHSDHHHRFNSCIWRQPYRHEGYGGKHGSDRYRRQRPHH